jgi:predicted amidohydrolase YtcJ
VRQAVKGFTSGAAYGAGTEKRQGTLAPGYLADLIVLEQDPFAVDPDELKSMRSSATMIGGEWVYEA